MDFKMTCGSCKPQCSCVLFLCFISFFLGAHSDCGPPPSIPNTKDVSETSGTPGQNVAYTCDREAGYYEVPDRSRTITCQDDGTWTNLVEFCTRACGVPERLEFAVPIRGALDLDIFYPGQNVSYECRNGYTRVFGVKTFITCFNNYTWSTAGKFCKPRSCGNPGEPDNGYMEADGFTFGSRVIYYCNEGYSMKNIRNYRDCQADGKWSNAVPVCEVAVCAAPRSPVNGSYYPEKDEYEHMDSVTFTCQKPLELVGTSSIACTAKGEWSDHIPTCKAVGCTNPDVKHSIRKAGFLGPYGLNSAIIFECEQGFFLNGSSSVKCNFSSQWEPDVPKCLTVCSDPPKVNNASLDNRFSELPHYFDGVTVTYQCVEGFYLNDKKNSVTCMDKAWTSYEQFCSPYCPDPAVSHAKMTRVKPGTTNTKFVLDEEVIIECEGAYVLKANGTNAVKSINVKCNLEGQWEPSLPECVSKHMTNKLNLGMIIGPVFAAVFLCLFGVIIYKCYKWQKQRGKPQPDNLTVQYHHCNA